MLSLRSTLIIIGLVLLAIFLVLFPVVKSYRASALVNTLQKTERNSYFGVVTEIDKGEGVFALEWSSFEHSASEWAGMIAEFKRRHPDLEILSHSIMVDFHISWANGIVIITTPKNRCSQ